MHVFLKNKKIIFLDYRIKCSIGKRGIKKKRTEGDKSTPKGIFKIKYLLYRKDRLSGIRTKLKKYSIKKNMGWCDDVNSKKYNKLIILPSNLKHEKLYIKDHIYDLVIVINYNMNPTVKNKGSAIFLHIAKKNYSPTKGCVAISKKNMRILLKNLGKKNKIIIY
jgi:L,D-peptidoglycan transpeptidase YkuD (ErfK/YbiS/YcfS/YnhG family)|tara:strand:- start:272 stop:763 length:492 start_codon:yes stop_codon:yes gene_type:complete